MGIAIERERRRRKEHTTSNGIALPNQGRPQSDTTRPYQRMVDASRGTGGQRAADGLGYFSLALGLAEVLTPTLMAKLVGVKHPDGFDRMTMRAMGVREIAAGLGILSSLQPATTVWMRVAGDVLDLTLLGRTLVNPENDTGRTLFATANVLAVTALDIKTARQLSRQPHTRVMEKAEEKLIVVKHSVTVNRPIDEVYSFWHNFENFPLFMRHLESVTVTGERHSHWVARGPAGKRVEWDAEMREDQPSELISWRSLPGSDVYNAGMVSFREAPGGRGTEIRVAMEYDPPFGKLGSKMAKLWHEEPDQQVRDSVRRFKEIMETGEVLLSDASQHRGPHSAQPSHEAQS